MAISTYYQKFLRNSCILLIALQAASAQASGNQNGPSEKISYTHLARMSLACLTVVADAYTQSHPDILKNIAMSEQAQSAARMVGAGAVGLLKETVFAYGAHYTSFVCHELGHWIFHPAKNARITINPDSGLSYKKPLFTSKWLQIDHWLPKNALYMHVSDPEMAANFMLPAHSNGYAHGITDPKKWDNITFKKYIQSQVCAGAGPLAGFISALGCYYLYATTGSPLGTIPHLSALAYTGYLCHVHVSNLLPTYLIIPGDTIKPNPGNYQEVKVPTDGGNMAILHQLYTKKIQYDWAADQHNLCVCTKDGTRPCEPCKKGKPKKYKLYNLLQDDAVVFGKNHVKYGLLAVASSIIVPAVSLAGIYHAIPKS